MANLLVLNITLIMIFLSIHVSDMAEQRRQTLPKGVILTKQASHPTMMVLLISYHLRPQKEIHKLSRTDRRTFRPRFRWEMLIHIWISPRHWKDASGEKRSLGSDTLYLFLCLETQVYKYIYVIVDHWFFWVTG